MSRRHKTPEELEKNQSHQPGSQGDSVLTRNALDNFNNVLSKTLSDAISDAIRHTCDAEYEKIINVFEHNLATSLVNSFGNLILVDSPGIMPVLVPSPPKDDEPNIIKKAFEKARRMIGGGEEEMIERRGRKTSTSILDGYENEDICLWFDKVRNGCKKFYGDLKRMLCCFFCALFDTAMWASPFQRETCYYRVMRNHIKEKIPSLSTVQKGIKWFWDWKRGFQTWKDKMKEVAEYKIWKLIYEYIMGELPRLQPSLMNI